MIPLVCRGDFAVRLSRRTEDDDTEDTQLAYWLDAVREHVDHECNERPRPLCDPKPCAHAGGRLTRCHVVRTADGERFLIVGVDDGEWGLSDFLTEFGNPHDGSMKPAFVGCKPLDDGSLSVDADFLPVLLSV